METDNVPSWGNYANSAQRCAQCIQMVAITECKQSQPTLSDLPIKI